MGAGFRALGLGIIATCRLVAVVVAVELMGLESRDARSSSWSLLLLFESNATGLCSWIIGGCELCSNEGAGEWRVGSVCARERVAVGRFRLQ